LNDEIYFIFLCKSKITPKVCFNKITNFMKLGLFLALIGLYGLILNKKNLILMIISIELFLLAVIFSFYMLYFFY